MKKTTIAVFAFIALLSGGCVNKSLLDSYEAHLNATEKEHMNYVRNGGEKLSESEIKARELKYKSARKVIRKYREYSQKWYIFDN